MRGPVAVSVCAQNFTQGTHEKLKRKVRIAHVKKNHRNGYVWSYRGHAVPRKEFRKSAFDLGLTTN